MLERKLIKEVSYKEQDKFIILNEKRFKFLERCITIIDFIEEFDL